jgi:hypothetical protein
MQYFGNWIRFHPQVRGWETHILLGPLERANPNHWTAYVNKLQLYIHLNHMMDKAQKPINPDCHAQLSEPFQIY